MKTLYLVKCDFSKGYFRQQKWKEEKSDLQHLQTPLINHIFLISWCTFSIEEARPPSYAKSMLKILEVLPGKNAKEVFGCEMHKYGCKVCELFQRRWAFEESQTQ